MLARFRRDPAFPDTGPAEPPGELLELRAHRDAALGAIDRIITSERAFADCDNWAIDLLLEVRQELAPANRLMRPSEPVTPGRSS